MWLCIIVAETETQTPAYPYNYKQVYDPWRCHGSLLRHPSLDFTSFAPIFRVLTGAPNSEMEHFSLALLVKSVRF
jgi:hypothetical protein